MLLKPATPLTILLLIAFVLLLLSVISTPIVKVIPLATFEDVDYGVFGYCKGGKCTNIHVGYTANDLSTTGDDFNLPSSARKSLSSILIVHPVAAFLTLICLCLAAAAHFHKPSHSPRYLLGLLILLLPTLLVTLLAFLVDILLFVPHLGWGGWIVLAATIIHVSCGVVTCAMRRTLVSRKARKRRIAENAEMSGENFYNRQNAAAAAAGLSGPNETDAKEAMVSGSPTSEGPTFATFRTNTRESDDDRTPLNSRTPPNDIGTAVSAPDPYPSRVVNNSSPYSTPRDEFGNPLPMAYGPGGRPNPGDARLRNQYSDGSMGPRRGPPPPGFVPRGRGGYPARGAYGRGGPYGAPRGRGGPMGPGRGVPPGMMGRGRGPPMGYGPGPGYGGASRGYDTYNLGVGPRPTPPPGEFVYDYGRPSPGPMRRPSPGPIGMAVSPDGDPMGQAIEMTPQPRRVGSTEPEGHTVPDPGTHALSADNYQEPTSPSSLYSRTESYVPPRSNWAQNTSPSPVHAYGAPPSRSPVHARSNSGSYYEDVEPRFADKQEGGSALPSALMPGHAGERAPPNPPDDVPDGSCSPTSSEISHFTSISERPINPRWRPPPIPEQQKTDVLLENNPDFELPAARSRGATTTAGGRMPPLPLPTERSRYPIP